MYKFLTASCLFMACKAENRKNIPNLTLHNIPVSKIINYDSCKRKIDTLKQQYKSEWNTLPTTKKEKIFTHAITKTIVPAWIGTQWAYNGITKIPQQGSIACGYFVTTVLRDAGLPLARIKLAQCASEEMIKTLVKEKNINRFSNVDFEAFTSFLKNNGDGLYIIGLDNHTGFILKDELGIWFIHSTFIGNGKVQCEDGEQSTILKNSKYKIVVKISADDFVLDRWIKIS